ncbi:hypothetical protein ElyMa_000879900 [Elysia marginata]|uniref:Uncharacterized protein n=1 Tax=Elysia marginata TaxID=1093978 RepID=A0AAV4H616_9GAST|nr:hypothetical protein ElyMa_000879900 [Elysia marginata]
MTFLLKALPCNSIIGLATIDKSWQTKVIRKKSPPPPPPQASHVNQDTSDRLGLSGRRPRDFFYPLTPGVFRMTQTIPALVSISLNTHRIVWRRAETSPQISRVLSLSGILPCRIAISSRILASHP